jgi:16S rRNA G1207 methylase RsmC
MTEHYFTEEQTTEFRPMKIPIRVKGVETQFYTSGGVFSPKRLDNGTLLLIESAIVGKGWKVLDLGCGYGVVGVLVKKKEPSIELVMSDVNSRAVKLAAMNAKLHGMEAKVLQSNGFDNKEFSGMMFDTILLNPPQTAGKDVCFALIDGSYEHLVKGGMLQLVVRSQKGGKQLSAKMEEVFGNVKDIAKGSGYRLYVGVRNKGGN